MSDLPPLQWFRVNGARDLDRLPKWLRRQRVNSSTGLRIDRRGQFIMLLGWDDKPDSDWGRFHGNTAAISFGHSAELAAAGEPAAFRAMGYVPHADEMESKPLADRIAKLAEWRAGRMTAERERQP